MKQVITVCQCNRSLKGKKPETYGSCQELILELLFKYLMEIWQWVLNNR